MNKFNEEKWLNKFNDQEYNCTKYLANEYIKLTIKNLRFSFKTYYLTKSGRIRKIFSGDKLKFKVSEDNPLVITTNHSKNKNKIASYEEYIGIIFWDHCIYYKGELIKRGRSRVYKDSTLKVGLRPNYNIDIRQKF